MTATQIEQMLKSTGIKVAYNNFQKAQTPPYMVYRFIDGKIRGADNKSGLISERVYEIELYTSEKNTECEKAIEAALISKNIEFDKNESYIDSEKLYMIIYSISFVEKI